jgi:subtilisin family serine protease
MEKEYVVTLENAEDADQFFAEMTAQSGTGQIPARSVDVVNARPGSLRNTDYALTEAEAEALRSDPRVLAVEIPVHLNPNVGSGPGLTQTGSFSKTTSSSGSNVNWGLIRCNATSNVYGSGNSTSQNYDYHLDGTGVDVVVVDYGIQVGHPEWEDAAGSSRLQQINWYTAAGVSGTQSGSFYTDANGHGTHVAGIAAGKTFGWARGAHIYSMKVDGVGAIAHSGVSYTAYDLIRLWHNAKPVQSNGYKRPTIVNASWQYWWNYSAAPTYINYRGSAKQGTLVDTSAERLSYGWAGDGTVSAFGNYVQPYRDTAIDAEVEDMISAGVIFVHSAGNFGYKTDAPGGPDYNNYAYGSSSTAARRYNRGCSPTGEGNSGLGFGDSIEVGNIDATVYSSALDQKATDSNAGPGVNIYAPGRNIVSAYSNSASGGSSYYLDSNYKQQILSGTSMAAPQVAGVAALIAQVNPQITPAEMKEYLVTKFGQTGDIYTSGQNNDFSNSRSLWGGSDVMLHNPFNTPTAYKITNSGSSGGTAPNISGSTSISIIENTSTSTVLATYTATGTTPITWSVTGTDASNFNINSSGQLTFAVSPDYETPADRSQSINVVATNSAGSDSHAVSITVTDDTSDNSGGGITSFDMGYTAAGQNRYAPNNQRAWCLERDTSYGYTGYAWFKNTNANTATQYYWSASSWTSQNVTRTFTALGTNWLGLADSGTLLCGVDNSGNISIINKSTGSQVASGSHTDNLQGVLWDGTYFWAGSFNTVGRVVRITTSGVTTNYVLPTFGTGKTNNRSAFYDFNKNYYYFGDTSAAHAYTFNGSSFTHVGQETSTEWTSQEGEYFEQSDGSKWLIAHNSTNLTSLTPV